MVHIERSSAVPMLSSCGDSALLNRLKCCSSTRGVCKLRLLIQCGSVCSLSTPVLLQRGPRKVLIVKKPVPAAAITLREMASWLQKRGLQVTVAQPAPMVSLICPPAGHKCTGLMSAYTNMACVLPMRLLHCFA